jgi:hypothetical protein
VGETTLEVSPVTDPTPWLMLRLVAPLTFQLSVLDAPLMMLAGLAVKLLMLGGGGGATAITTAAVRLPARFVAVSV